MTLASKTSVTTSDSTASTAAVKSAESETTRVEPVAQTKPAEEASVTAEDKSISETEPVEVTQAATVGEVENPNDGKGRNWTVISVILGISAAAVGIAVLKITKVV